jgi:hypothetical protein
MTETIDSVYESQTAAEELPEVKEGDLVSVNFAGPETRGIYVSVAGKVLDVVSDGFVVSDDTYEGKGLAVRAREEEDERRVHVQVVHPDRDGWEKVRTINKGWCSPDQVDIELRRKKDDSEETDKTDKGTEEQAKLLYGQSLKEPGQVDLEAIDRILSDPTSSPSTHANAILALTKVAAELDDVGGDFVDELDTLLGRPSLKTETVLRCLRYIASNDPGAVAELHEDVVSRIDVENDDVTRAATGCCVELVQHDPELLFGDVPVFGSLLQSDDETVCRNSVYVLTCVAEEYPEEVLPAVQDVIGSLEDGDPDGSKSSLIGKVSRHYPGATLNAVPALRRLLHEDTNLKTTANAVGALADIAAEYPEVAVEHGCVESASELLDHDDETVRYNTCGLLEEVSKGKPEAIDPVVPKLLERLEDDHVGVRVKTIYVLGEVREPRALEPLESIEEKDPSDRVREIAEKAVWRIKTE